MSAKIYTPDFEHTGPAIVDEVRHTNYAREFLAARPPSQVMAQWYWALCAVVVAAALDLGLMLYVQKQSDRFTDALGNFIGNSIELYAVAFLSLAVFFLIGYTWNKGGTGWRLLSGACFGLLLVWIVASIKTAYTPIFENLWPVQVNSFLAAESVPNAAPRWFIYSGVVISGLLYSVGGWCFLIAKARLSDALESCRHVNECLRKVAVADAADTLKAEREVLIQTKAHYSNPANAAALIREQIASAVAVAQREAARMKGNAAGVVQDITATKAEQEKAGADIQALENCLAGLKALTLSVMLLVGVAVIAAPNLAEAATTQEIIAAAPSVQVLVDCSPNPALNPVFLRQIWPKIESRLRAAPLGAEIVIQSIGNAAIQPLVFRARIYMKKTGDGDTRENVIRGAQAVLFSFPARFKENQQRSEIVGALSTAARELNPKATDNVIILLSDGWENSAYAACHGKNDCRLHLPAPDFSLRAASVFVYGIGQGADTKSSAALFREWDAFLLKTRAKVAELHRD
mgnify:FL=1